MKYCHSSDTGGECYKLCHMKVFFRNNNKIKGIASIKCYSVWKTKALWLKYEILSH
jgi:hypothetical protein